MKRSSDFEGCSGTDIWDPKTAILANMICTRNVGQKLKCDIWVLCATLYPFGGTGRIQYVTRGRGEYEVTYLFDPTWTYRLNHRSSTNFNQGFLLHSYLLDNAKRIRDRYIDSFLNQAKIWQLILLWFTCLVQIAKQFQVCNFYKTRKSTKEQLLVFLVDLSFIVLAVKRNLW